MPLPNRLLRDLTLLTPSTAPDAYGAQVPDTWDATTIRGRLQAATTAEDHDGGRDAEISGWLLLTDGPVPATARVADEDGTVYEVDGPARPVWAAHALHHHETALRLAAG